MISNKLLQAIVSESQIIDSAGINDKSLVFDQLTEFSNLVLKWTKTHNLTAIKDTDNFLKKHIVDSLSLLDFIKHFKTDSNLELLDVGSGAGFPSMPLGIADPSLQIKSVDASLKRIVFQKMVVRTIGLANVIPIHARMEDFKENDFDVITCRAVSSLSEVVSKTSQSIKDRGAWLLMKGQYPNDEISDFNASALAVDFHIKAVHEIQTPSISEHRHIVQIERKH